jgi:hypothetical protein
VSREVERRRMMMRVVMMRVSSRRLTIEIGAKGRGSRGF